VSRKELNKACVSNACDLVEAGLTYDAVESLPPEHSCATSRGYVPL